MSFDQGQNKVKRKEGGKTMLQKDMPGASEAQRATNASLYSRGLPFLADLTGKRASTETAQKASLGRYNAATSLTPDQASDTGTKSLGNKKSRRRSSGNLITRRRQLG